MGNTGGSEISDDSDYFCTLGVSGISAVLSVITVNLTDLVIVVHLVWGVKNVNFLYYLSDLDLVNPVILKTW